MKKILINIFQLFILVICLIIMLPANLLILIVYGLSIIRGYIIGDADTTSYWKITKTLTDVIEKVVFFTLEH